MPVQHHLRPVHDGQHHLSTDRSHRLTGSRLQAHQHPGRYVIQAQTADLSLCVGLHLLKPLHKVCMRDQTTCNPLNLCGIKVQTSLLGFGVVLVFV